ncbi:hypothetical protein MSLAZ_0179 [Methanosarcina lacustris Z-7289]|uniref:Uncharacterized protein n=1 Tax=Methanosarcina lacustris Z-7289 TaxID=1434111 RepID=A0A0E3WRW7_9EURY|nr:hypothetical protein [Methanosarcina lacustris]AKB73440.1 hypothetical protein MSLAZ_0179 [Methanosarcina lacustris Z-7289]
MRVLLKKWFVILLLICAIFAVSSKCSENSKEDTNIPDESVEASEGEVSTEDTGEDQVDVEMVSTGDTSNWYSAGSSWKTTDPQTGE